MTCIHSTATSHALAYRLVLAALDYDDSDASHHTIGSLAAELDDSCPGCRNIVTFVLARFAADRIKRSATPKRWERWLTDRIAQLLDAAQEADA